MGKRKFVMMNGQKMFIDEKDLGEEDDGQGEGAAEGAESEDGEIDAETKAAAQKLGSALRKELGLDAMSEQIKTLTEQNLNQPENSKLKEILHGKDLVKDKATLTAEEKIVGFFHGLVTQNHEITKALAEGVSADGGYLFPAEFLAELVRPLANENRMRSLVRVITMKRNVLKAPSLVNRPKVYWTAENASKTTTTANFGEVTLTARKAAAIIYSSDELIEDSSDIDVVRLIIDLFAEAIGEEEDRVILRGNGTTEPTGIETARNAGTIASVTCSGNLDFDDIIELEYALKAKYRKGSSFLVHPTNVKELRKIKDTNGRYIWEESRVTGQPATLLGYPVGEFYDVPESIIYFGNWKMAYWLGDRKGMTVKVTNDSETAFTKDQTGIRVVIRLAGNVVLGEAAKALTSIP